jgi:hypothetical protein
MAMLSNRTGEVVAKTDNKTEERAVGRTGTVDTTVPAADDTTKVDTGLLRRRRLQERTASATRAASDTGTMPAVTETVIAGPRPRASLWATTSLVLGVVAAVAVLTGLLAGPGVAVGLLAAFAGLGGIAATSRRHVAGKSDALLGLGLGLAAIVLGVLALTRNLSWLNGDINMVTQVHAWLAAHASWLLP